jgi:hypothetical protein
MAIASDDGGILLAGVAHRISVLYLDSNGHPVPDGTEVTWSGFPSDKLQFLDGEKTRTSVGIATNRVGTYDISIDGPQIFNVPVAAVTTTAFNPLTGANDYGNLSLSFWQAPVVGIKVDKPYAKNPAFGHSIKPKDPSNVIKCQVQVLGQSGPQKVFLPTDQDNARVITMFDASGKRMVPDPDTGTYYVTTNGNDPVSFFVGSENYTRLTINTQWQGQARPASTMLVLATNDKDPGQPLAAPTVQGLQGHTLAIPAGCPAATFKVNIPGSSTLGGTGKVALILNDRLVYHGPADLALDPYRGVDIAYAALNLTGSNALVYVASVSSGWNESKPCSFTVDTANGNPQTGPCRALRRELVAPGVNAPQTVGALDILPSLDIFITPYPNMTPGDDVITAFFYLQGSDVLTKRTVNNIVPISYSLTSESPLLIGKSVALSLPQWAAAGYANGQLQVDYRVVSNATGTRWSKVSPLVTLSTTIPFTS